MNVTPEPLTDTREQAVEIVAGSPHDGRRYFDLDANEWIDPEGYAVGRYGGSHMFFQTYGPAQTFEGVVADVAAYLQTLPTQDWSKGVVVVETGPCGEEEHGIGLFVVDPVFDRALAQSMARERGEEVYFSFANDGVIHPTEPFAAHKVQHVLSMLSRYPDGVLYDLIDDTFQQPTSGYAVVNREEPLDTIAPEKLAGIEDAVADWIGRQRDLGCVLVQLWAKPIAPGLAQAMGVGLFVCESQENAKLAAALNGFGHYFDLANNAPVEFASVMGSDDGTT